MRVRYDLHLHSALSPCAEDDMTPINLVQMAQLAGLALIALTDHNSCGNCAAAMEAGGRLGLGVVPGMELCTAEEIHVLCLFPTLEDALAFESVIRPLLPDIPENPAFFGNQLLFDADDRPAGHAPILLSTAAGLSLEDVPALVEAHHGVAVPAHLDRASYSIPAALGDVPPLPFPAYELTAQADVPAFMERYPVLRDKPLLQSSDAHALAAIADAGPWLELPEASPQALIDALRSGAPAWGRE